ncbi:hypothetical protein OKA04_13510 [Luteolibacter flavescens]|uniref:Uncharacterized protein n=1 Tax=Luteolibacter flavescens TaxID=1859460 RepID=A0ABT3FQA8_9BACT|nr:hypothetical protein [Luteolibacter flavescens]MCW1885752.1 hypothetical protein [Luteolibacter flavescens]
MSHDRMGAPGKLLLIAAMALPAGYLALAWFSSAPPAAVQATAKQPLRSPDVSAANSSKVYEKSFGSEGADLRRVVYRISEAGSPLTCEIFDGKGERLLKCRFGYHAKSGPTYGKVAEVQIFSAQPGHPLKDVSPLRRIVYPYDADGVVSTPETIDVQQPGVIEALLGSALTGFNPLTEWESASKQGLIR